MSNAGRFFGITLLLVGGAGYYFVGDSSSRTSTEQPAEENESPMDRSPASASLMGSLTNDLADGSSAQTNDAPQASGENNLAPTPDENLAGDSENGPIAERYSQQSFEELAALMGDVHAETVLLTRIAENPQQARSTLQAMMQNPAEKDVAVGAYIVWGRALEDPDAIRALENEVSLVANDSEASESYFIREAKEVIKKASENS